MAHISDIQNQIWDDNEAKGWHEDTRTPGDHIALIMTELGEAMDAYRDTGSVHQVWHRDDGKPEGFIYELADALIRILDTASIYGFNLEGAVLDKLAYNRTRPHRHGGKAL